MKTATKGLFKSTVLVTTFTVMSIFLSFATQLVIAFYFGVTSERDAYFAALVIPTYISALFTGSIGFLFLPIYVNAQNENSKKETEVFFNSAVTLTLLVSTVFVLLVVTFSERIITLSAPGFTGGKLVLTSKLLMLLIPSIIFQIGGNLAASVLQIRSKYLLPSLGPVVSGVIILLTVVFLSKFYGIYSLAFGTLVGSAVACFLNFWGLRKLDQFRLLLNFKNSNLKRLIKSSVPLFFAGILFRLTGVFERGIASTLPAGSISYLGYANQVMAILATITSSGVAVSIYPLLSKAWVNDDKEQLFFYFHKGIRIILMMTLPISVVFVLWGDMVIGLMFERGAFDHSATTAVHYAFSVMVFAFVANCLGSIIVKIFYLSNRTIRASFSELAGLLFYIIPAFLLSKPYGYIGMAVATSIGATASILLSFYLAIRILGSFQIVNLMRDLYKVVLSLAFASLISVTFFRFLIVYDVPAIAVLTCTLFILASAYLFFLNRFRIEEVKDLKLLYHSAYEKIIG